MSADLRRIARALVSVSDKGGIVDFARALAAMGVALISTGGTREALAAAGLAVEDVSDITGFPEMMDGRVKTLHPKVHGGLLAIRENPAHEAAMLAHGIGPIDLLAVDLYPFEAALARGAGFGGCIENIDIGGPAMIRAAAKNHADVAVVVEGADYARVLGEMRAHGGCTSMALRRALAQKAYARTASYDAAISNWLATEIGEAAPAFRAFGGPLLQAMRYGENPHQSAALYALADGRPGVAGARQLQGKPLSYNNVCDADAAFECVAEFAAPAVVIVKHANPCGVATGATLAQAHARALACDPTSAFGGIVAVNRRLDAEAARAIVDVFTEAIVAPEADEEAIALIAAKRNLRLLLAGAMPDPRAPGLTARTVAGGMLVQSRDNAMVDETALKVATRRTPTKAEMRDLLFAWRVAKHVKSNAIVLARDEATIGIGAGQTSRVDAARIAAWKAGAPQACVVASDAFFPFADGVLVAAQAGATAAIQPGGSQRDPEVIAAADAAGMAMVFTGARHFRH